MRFKFGAKHDKSMYTHVCQIEEQKEVLLPLPAKASCWARFKRFLLLTTLIWKNHEYTGRYFKSHNAVNAEMIRQLSYNKTYVTIHPFSKFWFAWCSYMCIIFFLNIAATPFSATFIDYEHLHGSDHMIIFCSISLFLHLIFEFRVGYVDSNTKKVVLNKYAIRHKYLCSHFFVDILSVIPVHTICRVFKYHTYLTAPFGLMKIFRIDSFLSYFSMACTNLSIADTSVRWTLQIFILFVVVHYCGCLLFYFPMLTHEVGFYLKNASGLTAESWIVKYELFDLATSTKSETPHFIFFLCSSMSLSMLLGTAGNVIFTTLEDIIMGSFLEILFYVFYWYGMVKGVAFFTLAKSSEIKYQEIMNQLEEYLGHNQIPEDLQDRIRRYYVYRFQKRFFNDKAVMEMLSPSMRQEIVVSCCSIMVQSVEILKNLPKNLLDEIFRCMRHEVFLPNDVIAKAGTYGDCMYFLTTGTVTIVTPTGKEVTHLEDGDHFGEISLLIGDMKRVANVIAIETCDVYRLDRRDFLRCIGNNKELQTRLMDIAKERTHVTKELEEAHKKIMAQQL